MRGANVDPLARPDAALAAAAAAADEYRQTVSVANERRIFSMLYRTVSTKPIYSIDCGNGSKGLIRPTTE
jgi:hypothetical protein